MRRQDDETALEHITNARQLLWFVTDSLRARQSPPQQVHDLVAADWRLMKAVAYMTHPRALTAEEWEEQQMTLKLAAPTPKDDITQTLSKPLCEAIAKAWHAVAFLEEIRNDLKGVRQSAARDMASGAFATAITHLVLGANLLQPTELLQRPQITETAAGGDG